MVVLFTSVLLDTQTADNTTLGLEEDPTKWEIQIEGVEVKTVLLQRKHANI